MPRRGTHTTDYVLMPNNVVEHSDGTLIREAHFDREVDLGNGLRIGPIGPLGQDIMDACEERGENWSPPTRQFGVQYAVYRVDAPGGFFVWDPDDRIKTCLALSRLVRPTSIAPHYAARVIEEEGRPRTIAPARRHGPGELAFVLDEDQDWLRDADVAALRDLLAMYNPKDLPERVGRALWHHEYAAWTYHVDVRWTLVTIGLECLVHTDDRGRQNGKGSTKQFVTRVGALRQRVDGLIIAESDLRDMYDLRSSLAHGRGLGSFSSRERTLYRTMEETLRFAVRKTIEDPSFARLFASDDSVRTALDE